MTERTTNLMFSSNIFLSKLKHQNYTIETIFRCLCSEIIAIVLQSNSFYIMLLLNIFLVLIILMNNAKDSTPAVNRINAIDIYTAACNIHVFFAILEYAILLLLMKCLDLEWKRWSHQENLGFIGNKWNTMKVKEISTSKI